MSAQKAPVANPAEPSGEDRSLPRRFETFLGRPLFRLLTIWVPFFALLYALRAFFTLIFLTFVLSYVSHRVARGLSRRMRLPRRTVVVIVYALLLVLLGVIGTAAVPALYRQASEFIRDLPDTGRSLVASFEKMAADSRYALLTQFVNLEEIQQQALGEIVGTLKSYLQILFGVLANFLLSILLSFLIVLDLPRLAEEARSLERTRLRRVYDDVAPSVESFFGTIGMVLESRAIIAIVITVLATAGLWWLKLSSLLLLASFLFVLTFIPVAGIYIAAVPISLVAFRAEGFSLMLVSLGVVVFLHVVETYVLNPRIMGAQLKMNPVVVLAVLMVSGYFFHVWGLVLGVPVFYYVRYRVLPVPEARDGKGGAASSGSLRPV